MRRFLDFMRSFFAPTPPEVPPQVPHLVLLGGGPYRTPQEPQMTYCELCGLPASDTNPCAARLKPGGKETE